MPCDTRWIEPAEIREAREALTELDALIATGAVKVCRNAKGQIEISGWEASRARRAGWCDGCLIRKLEASGSLSARMRLRDARLRPAERFAGHALHAGKRDHDH